MIARTLAKKLRAAVRKFPVVTVTGPRQSGKTTLVRDALRGHRYVSLELPDQRAFALEDPRGFLAQFDAPVILDEAQRAPDLFSYIQVLVDEDGAPGRFVLTGSQNFLLLQRVSQSLAGRACVLHLLPFSLSEINRRDPVPVPAWTLPRMRRRVLPDADLFAHLFTGFYPPIHDRRIPPTDWLNSYYQTYLERDVRNVVNVGDIENFSRFVALCAGRNGQILNLSSLANDCGVSHTTARRWLSVLEASFLVVLLRPHFRNFGKRLIKSPKLYFLDPGLLCYLLRVPSPEALAQSPYRGVIFESLIVSEVQKTFLHMGERPPLYFWRDAAGHEIDLVVDLGDRLLPIEIKSGRTVTPDFFGGLRFWRSLKGSGATNGFLIHGGDEIYVREGVNVFPWHVL